MNQRSIKMDNAAVTAALFGSFDVNTRILENRFGVSLHNRSDGDGGDAVLISGESPEAVNAAATAVEYLRDMLRLSDSLNEQTVRYVADTVAEGRASELTSLSPDIICLTAKGKPVKASPSTWRLSGRIRLYWASDLPERARPFWLLPWLSRHCGRSRFRALF